MLVFESVSAGGFAVFLVLAAVLVLVGFYTYLVWPFTKWDLADPSLDRLLLWSEYALILIFIAGAAAGFWCFSGEAFRQKSGRAGRGIPARNPKRR